MPRIPTLISWGWPKIALSMVNLLKIIPIMAIIAMSGCSSAGTKAATATAEAAPERNFNFNADSAYQFVAQQVAFGPRVPGSASAKACAKWIEDKLKSYGADSVTAQRATLTAYNGDRLDITNISAQFNPSANDRVLLLAHWDTRPWADQEADADLREKPIDGANDGASGVAVILELARHFAQNPPKCGVDILLVDAEDYGRRSDQPQLDEDTDSWALGTQYWLEHPTLDLGRVQYAVLLDMVGGKDAVFPREYHSEYACPSVNDKVWQAARKAGHGKRFPDRLGGAVVDDHVYFIMARIPAIDIIESNNPTTGTFPPAWHTHADNLSNIDPATLRAVGETLEQLLCNEK